MNKENTDLHLEYLKHNEIKRRQHEKEVKEGKYARTFIRRLS